MLELYELFKGAITGSITRDVLFEKLKEASEQTADQDDHIDTIADILVLIDLETSQTCKEHRETFLNTVKALIKENVLPTSIALERFETDTNAAVGIISDKRQFMVSYNRLRTKLYFKQKKFNLLREENEGFARVITELSLLSPTNVEEALTSVTEIIGKYRVDPNRVLDLFLEVFEHSSATDHDFYIRFLKLFYNNQQKILQLIMLKLSFYSGNKNEEIPMATIVPQSFNRLIAILINKDVIDLEEIYPYLTPPDGEILQHHKRLVEEAKLFARKYAMIIVGEEKPAIKPVAPESLQEEDPIVQETGNQKINICAHLFDIGAWEQALYLARKLPEFYCLSHRRVSSSVCDLINYLIDPLYREIALPKSLNARVKPVPFRSWAPPQLTSMTDAPSILFPILTALGPFLSSDTLVLTKVIRLLKSILNNKQGNQEVTLPEGPLFYQILDVINECILPAVALSGSNCCLARELWSMMRNIKYHIRYKLYFNWRDDGSNPIMLKNRGHALLKAKHHMKRLSKETLRFTARHLGKLCYSNPVIVLHYIVMQVQSYDNLIGIVVDALRFLPAIAIDALLYCIIETLSDANRNRKAYDGVAFAPWLTSLSTFAAQIILRYKVEFTGFLEYIGNQLKAGNSSVLILLTDLIQKMTGIETITAITDDRIEALMGGDVLRTEGAYFNQVKNTRKPSARLKDALIESRLAVPLCILIAQLRDGFFFGQQEKDGTPLKLIGKLYDQCQETLVQYGMFLSINLSIDDYINFLPSLEKLMREYKLDTDSAFFLARPMIFHKIKSKFIALKQEATQCMMTEEGESPELSKQEAGAKFIEAAKSIIDPIATAIQPSLIEKYGSYSGAKLFVIFWTMSMSDIEVPTGCYEREIQRLKTTLSEIGRSSDDDPKRRKERERCNSLVQKLKQEQADQAEHVAYIRMYLNSEMDNLFSNNGNSQDVYTESKKFVQHCAFARSILTASDAIYSARFLLVLHELKVRNYPTIFCLDRLLCDLTHMMGGCTENEANHYGRFLGHILKTTGHWHSSAAVFHEQCEHFPGSIINGDNLEPITYDNYRDICYKWHYRLTRAFTIALESNNYIQIRNALNVMISIIEYYPAIRHFGKSIGMKIEDVRNSEKSSRQDLYALATAYAGRLEERKPTLIPESSFHTVSSVRKKSDGSSRPASPTYRERHSSSSSRKKARHS